MDHMFTYKCMLMQSSGQRELPAGTAHSYRLIGQDSHFGNKFPSGRRKSNCRLPTTQSVAILVDTIRVEAQAGDVDGGVGLEV